MQFIASYLPDLSVSLLKKYKLDAFCGCNAIVASFIVLLRALLGSFVPCIEPDERLTVFSATVSLSSLHVVS